MPEKNKAVKIIAFVILAVSLLPWAFTLCVSIISFFAGTEVGLFEATKMVYGADAFMYTWVMYWFVFTPVYVITAITAIISTTVLIVIKKKGASSGDDTPKVIMTCGKICSGKSTYARKLRDENKAVILSVDEITLALFGQDAGEKHSEYVAKLEEYLFGKSAEIAETGTNVVLDWGFWLKSERDYARSFYKKHGIPCELHYISISEEEWDRRIEKRNADVAAGRTSAYYVDDGLKAKFREMFEPPEENECDVVIKA